MATINELIAKGEPMPIIAAQEAMVYQDGYAIGFATNVRISIDYGTTPVKTLGRLGPIDFKHMDYNARMTVGTFMIKAGVDIEGVLRIPNRNTMVQAPNLVFEMRDVNSNVFYRISGCRIATVDLSFQEGQLVTKDTEWLAMEVTPVAVQGENLGG